ncbi:asparagine--tRNA ligase [Rhodocaloribacter litoris]|uniref:asparagine--tRNA ligase n=1 Tax=Rhodocaloribacter litoris TaxID=2558931 RepID=UPI00141EB63A|nr:asparagine--tRNA ligase [Rhodocaloribacter litoris]QXD16374.1 asparagine--tRNA ligase [Rhodocaloribacter litoris]
MEREPTYIEHLNRHEGETVTLKGWLYNKRASKGIFFLILRDGTGLVQCVVTQDAVDEATWQAADEATQESALEVTGTVRRDERQVGGYEVQATTVRLLHRAEDYPITPKEHGIEFLMNHRHLWLRSRRPWATLRIRNRIIMAIHRFFQERGFLQMDAPILTGNAVEGTSTLFEIDYFDRKAYLTQSGQLHGEAMAMAFGKIYTFGPTFRAEKSKTRRHLTEFWMIEPEMAFYDLDMNMQLAEDLIVHIVQTVLREARMELEVLGRDTAPLERVRPPFPRVAYDEAVEILRSDETARMIEEKIEALKEEETALKAEMEANRKRYGQAKKAEKRRIDAREIEIHRRLAEIEEDLRNLPQWAESARNFAWGNDFGGSDETVLTWHFDRPIIVHRFPAAVKAFYMKRDPEDDRLALGMDVLAPEGYGEIIGGGERATDLAFLERQVQEHNLPPEVFDWYFDLRRYGSVPHSGFGLGLERTVAWICGLAHLREAIPFPRLIDRLTP